MPLADLKVIGVVRGRDFDDATSERRVDVFVGNDRNPHVRDWNQDLASDQPLESLVVGVNRESHVAKHCLWARRRDGQVAKNGVRVSCPNLFGRGAQLPTAVEIRDSIEDVIEVSRFLAVLGLFVAK